MKSVSYFVSFGVGKLHVSGLYSTTKYPILHRGLLSSSLFPKVL